MKQIVNSTQMKELDWDTIQGKGVPSLVLMERAALSVVEELKQQYDLTNLLIICGCGNNGADGMAIARILYLQGYHVSVFLAGKETSFSPECKIQWEILKNYSIPIVYKCCYNEYTTIVDAIFGVGLSRNISGTYLELIESMNASKIPIVSVDIPSGIHGTTGQVMQTTVKADCTVTFAYGKTGLYLYPGAHYAGTVIVKDIGIYGTKENTLYAIDEKEWNWLPLRTAEGNKGTFGKALIIAGSKHMCGAAYFSAKASLMMGAGMVRIFTSENNRSVLQQLLPEVLMSTYQDEWNKEELTKELQKACAWATTILIGPGLSTDLQAQWMVEELLKTETEKTLIMDADALNILSKQMNPFYQTKLHCVLTPHMGEMSRISGYSMEKLKENPVECIQTFQKNFIKAPEIIMKDARTLTLTSEKHCYINLTGNNGMATAGSGDVLAGIVTGLIAQGIKPCKAAPFGVWFHGKAGDFARDQKGERSMLASDILEAIPMLLKNKA